jgi:5-methyltetrahydropteroyltriglutamate--homocysteine methyltransferase
MKRSTDRILTTHVGSLARPGDLLDLMKARAAGGPNDEATFGSRVKGAVADSVRAQLDSGIDVVSDGEQSKTGFFAYVTQRLSGFQARPGGPRNRWEPEVREFPEYYEQYFAQAMTGGAVAPIVPLVCTGPVSYRGQEELQRDIENLKAATEAMPAPEVFMPAVAPSGVGSNEYYPSEVDYLFAVADAMHEEYQAIVDAGFILQVDDPFLTDLFSFSGLGPGERQKAGELYVEAINRGLKDIPPDRVRFHTCYGINEGPRVHDAPLTDVIDLMLRVNAGAYSFEAANPRHEHEYRVWEAVKLPADKILIPGVITHASNIVEHPAYIAERIIRYAKIVGRENVIAGADCGFSSQATYHPEVHPKVVWAKFRAMAEGARIASTELWGSG